MLDTTNGTVGQYPSSYLPYEHISIFSLTAVVHDRNDKLSLIFGIISLLPITLIIVSLTIGVLLARDNIGCTNRTRLMYWAFAATGMTVSCVVNIILKSIIRESRPVHHITRRVEEATVLGAGKGLITPFHWGVHSGYGMPSSHSQFMSYVATVVMLMNVNVSKCRGGSEVRSSNNRTNNNNSNNNNKNYSKSIKNSSYSSVWTFKGLYFYISLLNPDLYSPVSRHIFRSLLFWVAAVLVGVSRVYLHHHTVQQVCMGWLCGVIIAVLNYRVSFIRHIIERISEVTFCLLFDFVAAILVL
eukprot:Tbor_TRINITY_DN5401_c6_g2::TRINITY_DN5401_c6_g2_i1::g.24288::m.24288/K07252/E3.6.1.43; dolichyldiphosphatase